MFKKKVPAEVIAAGLFKFLEGFGQGQSGMEQVERIIADLSEPDKANVRLELKLLEVATIDYGVYDVLGNTPVKKAVLDAFYAFLRHESERFFGCSPSVIAPKIIDRLSEYAKALKTPHELGPFFMIVKTFSQFCSGKGDANLAFIGSIFSQGKLQFLPLKNFLKDCEIEV